MKNISFILKFPRAVLIDYLLLIGSGFQLFVVADGHYSTPAFMSEFTAHSACMQKCSSYRSPFFLLSVLTDTESSLLLQLLLKLLDS